MFDFLMCFFGGGGGSADCLKRLRDKLGWGGGGVSIKRKRVVVFLNLPIK